MKRGRPLKKWTGAFQVAAVYVGTVIGAGFATGKEIVEFFSQYGIAGFIGILLVGYLFIFLGSKIMTISIEIRAKSYEEFNEYLFGKKLAKIMNIFTMLMLIGVCAVMLSGAEALFVEQLHLSKSIGSIITITLALLVMAMGVRGIFAVNTFVVPMLIIFNITLLIVTLTNDYFIQNFWLTSDKQFSWRVIMSAFSYSAFNLTLAQAVLVPIATEVNDKEIVKRGGILGGIFLTVILAASHVTLLSLPELMIFEIPMAVIVKSTISSIYVVYLFIIYGEIFTSLIGNLYGLEKQIKKYISVKSVFIYLGIIMIVYGISRVEYGKLLSLLYPAFGYISLIFLVLLWLKPVKK